MKHIIHDDTSTGEGNYNYMHEKPIYEVEYTEGTMKQLISNIIVENMISKVYSKDYHYQVLTEVTDKNR